MSRCCGLLAGVGVCVCAVTDCGAMSVVRSEGFDQVPVVNSDGVVLGMITEVCC